MKPHQKKSLKYLLIIAGLITLYLTGLHKPIAATLQRGMLMTGLFNPSLNEVPEKTDKVVVKGKNTPEVVPGDMADLDVQFFNEAGELVNLSAMPQQPYFINFWATWCPPCRKEMPSLDALWVRSVEERAVAAAQRALTASSTAARRIIISLCLFFARQDASADSQQIAF